MPEEARGFQDYYTTGRCYIHPHRVTETRCERCSTLYCDECLTQYDDKMLCAKCVRESEDAKAIAAWNRRPFWQKLQPSWSWLVGSLIILLVALSLGIYTVRVAPNMRVTEDEIFRMRYAISQGMMDWLNVNSGGTIESVTSEDLPDWAAANLIDGMVAPSSPGWRSKGPLFPQEIVVRIENIALTDHLTLNTMSPAPADSYPRQIEVWLADESEQFTLAGTYEMKQGATQQDFRYNTQRTLLIKLRILSNWGNADYTALAAVSTYDALAMPEE